MKIDRQNIPEEYQCVNCCPREVDYQAARSLQLQKRKEQQNQILSGYTLPGMFDGISGKSSHNSSKSIEKKTNGLKQRKPYVSKKSLDGNNPNKRTKRSELAKKVGLKRKDLKRSSKKKQKSNENSSSADKMALTLRNWIDNYEVAMTNHYSPELRARLTALGKHQPCMSSTESNNDNLNLGALNNHVPSCTTVPHAGAKILISTKEIEPFESVIEIRGKYMLTSQHKSANNILSKKPISGPFLFFYSVSKSGPDICVDTRTYGNEARFVRRSCRPNAEILHNIEKNVIHLYIVSKVKIMASTEITIAHDQNVDPATSTHSMSHTSTLCACGLLRECKFANGLNLSSSTTNLAQIMTPLLPPAAKRKNGIHSSVGGEKEKRKYKKRNKDNLAKENKFIKEGARNRGRSTSSSCESHVGLMSPPLKNYEPDFHQHQQPQHHQNLPPTPIQVTLPYHTSSTKDPNQHIPTTPVAATQEHTIFYDSASFARNNVEFVPSPPAQSVELVVIDQSARVLSKALINDTNSPLSPLSPAASTSFQSQDQAPCVVVATNTPPIVNSSTNSHTNPKTPSGTNVLAPILPSSQPNHELRASPLLSPTKNSPVLSEVHQSTPSEAVAKSTVTTPQKNNKRGNKLQRSATNEPATNSLSEDQHLNATVKTPLTPGSSKEDEKPHGKSTKLSSTETRKLTREERKMEAIVKAFEKMEKNMQRKQEQKAQKNTIKKSRASQNALKKQNLSTQRRKVLCQRRKKRKSKSISSRSKSGDNQQYASGGSVFTNHQLSSGEKQSKQATLKTSTVTTMTNLSNNNVYNSHMNKSDLILSYNQLKSEADTNLSGIPPLISPACKLIEAAFDSFEQTTNENEFKFPKTKTKKDLMNEWLNQSNDNSMVKPDYESGYNVGETKPLTNYDSNIKMVTKTVEQFISQNRLSFDNEESAPLIKNEDYESHKAQSTPPQSSSPQNESTGTFIGSESAVKKRWLRQAISEETNDESNLLQVEFSTPLKKRRVFIDEASSSAMVVDTNTHLKVETNNEISCNEKLKPIKEELDSFQVPSALYSELKLKLEEDTTVTSTVAENDQVQPTGDSVATTIDADDITTTKHSDSDDNAFNNESESTTNNEILFSEKEELVDEDNKSSNSEEIAEYEKVIASFHTENIMMLQTRNKKSKINTDNNIPVDMDTARSKSTPIKLKFKIDGEIEPKTSNASDRTKSLSPESTTSNATSSGFDNSTKSEKTSPVDPRHVQETIPFGGSRYLNNISRSSAEVPSILNTNPPSILSDEPPPILSAVSGAPYGLKPGFNNYGYRPMMTNLTMNEFPDTTGQIAHPTPISSYLKSYTKATLITDPKAPIGSTLTGQFATVETAAFPSAFAPTSQFLNCDKLNPNVPVTPPNYLSTKSYSSLNDTSANTYYTAKIFTKTQNSDPRVNQSLHDTDQTDTKVEAKPMPKKKVSSSFTLW